MDAPEAVREATLDLIGRPVEALLPPQPREGAVEDVTQLYASNEAIADAAGYGRGAPGSDERRRYRSFMRNLQRYRRGRAPGPELRGVLRRLADNERRRQRRAATPRNLLQVVRLIHQLGLTVTLAATVRVSRDERFRDVPGVYIPPTSGLLHGYTAAALEDDWEGAAYALGAAWGEAYGIGVGVEWDDVDTLDLSIG